MADTENKEKTSITEKFNDNLDENSGENHSFLGVFRGRNVDEPYTHYMKKKTFAQGLLDKALLAANASQLKVVWQLKGQEPFFELQVSMLIGSIILQLIVALLLWYETMTNLHDPPNRLNYEHRDEYEVALRDWWNNNGQRNRARHVGSTISTLFIIVILFMNIIIAVFGVNIPPAEKHFNGNIPINESLERN